MARLSCTVSALRCVGSGHGVADYVVCGTSNGDVVFRNVYTLAVCQVIRPVSSVDSIVDSDSSTAMDLSLAAGDAVGSLFGSVLAMDLSTGGHHMTVLYSSGALMIYDLPSNNIDPPALTYGRWAADTGQFGSLWPASCTVCCSPSQRFVVVVVCPAQLRRCEMPC